MDKKILIVDDEQDIIEFISYNLELEGYLVISANDGEEALEKVSEMPDLIILDIMMPKMNGFQTLQEIKKNILYKNIPILFLTAKTSEIDEVKGLNLGADDYLKKPISPMTVVARVKTILRRIQATNPDEKETQKIIKNGPVKIDLESYRFYINDEETFLPKKEFELIGYLCANPGKVFSRDHILEKIWGSDVIVTDRTVDVHIRKIREKLNSHYDLIETIKGVGYRVKKFEQ
ncbi:MAG: response regulator transcription factor [Melioribacteraceae bacterium]|nr:response regulator transcription factor [Melioribacteraceae bacterium]